MKCRIGALSALLLATSSLADPPSPCLLAQVDATFQASPNLDRPKVIIPQGCNRPFLFRGEIYSVDSPQAQDAQGLKYITRESSQAQILLTRYQDNRSLARISAYTGTLGIVLAVFSTGLGRWLAPRNPNPIQTAALVTGAAIALEGISYSMMLMRENESLIPRSVEAYNKDKPKDPVELQFTAGWSF